MTWTRPDVLIPPAADFALRIKHQVSPGWRQAYLLTSDIHWDSPECYIRLLHKHLAEANARNALWIDNGDFGDVIGGIYDKRATKGSVIEELQGINYLDRYVDLAADEFEYAAERLIYVGTGNHETSVLVKKETDVTRRVVDELNRRRDPKIPPIYRAGYTGWIRFMFERGQTRQSMFMKLEHGTGGNSPVTKGTIQANRRQVRTHGAQFFVTGHIHEQWTMPYIVETPNLSSSRIELRKCQHIQLGSYKMDFRHDGTATWAQMKMGDPKPIGGVWLEFFADESDVNVVHWNVTPTNVDYSKLADYLRPEVRISR